MNVVYESILYKDIITPSLFFKIRGMGSHKSTAFVGVTHVFIDAETVPHVQILPHPLNLAKRHKTRN